MSDVEYRLEKVETKLDLVIENQAKQGVILEEHQRRSLANEEAVKVLKDELKPIYVHVIKVQTVIKIIGFVLTLLFSSDLLLHFLK